MPTFDLPDPALDELVQETMLRSSKGSRRSIKGRPRITAFYQQTIGGTISKKSTINEGELFKRLATHHDCFMVRDSILKRDDNLVVPEGQTECPFGFVTLTETNKKTIETLYINNELGVKSSTMYTEILESLSTAGIQSIIVTDELAVALLRESLVDKVLISLTSESLPLLEDGISYSCRLNNLKSYNWNDQIILSGEPNLSS